MGAIPKRNMILHEYHAAQLVRYYNVPIPIGHIAFSSKEAYAIARKLEASSYMVKAQVQVYGRTRGHFLENGFIGGIHHIESFDEVE